MINPNDLPIVLNYLTPNSTWVVRDDSDGNYAYIGQWYGPDTQPTQIEIDAAEVAAVDAHNKLMLKVTADNELIARSTGKINFIEVEIATLMPTDDKDDRAAIEIKIDDGTYDTDEKVRTATEWRKPEPG